MHERVPCHVRRGRHETRSKGRNRRFINPSSRMFASCNGTMTHSSSVKRHVREDMAQLWLKARESRSRYGICIWILLSYRSELPPAPSVSRACGVTQGLSFPVLASPRPPPPYGEISVRTFSNWLCRANGWNSQLATVFSVRWTNQPYRRSSENGNWAGTLCLCALISSHCTAGCIFTHSFHLSSRLLSKRKVPLDNLLRLFYRQSSSVEYLLMDPDWFRSVYLF